MNYFDNIYDLPIVRYHKVIEESELKYLLHEVPKDSQNDKEELIQAWEKINEQIIDEFGVSNEFEAIFYKQNTINKLEIEQLLGDNSRATLCEVLKIEVNELKSKVKEVKDVRKYHARLHRILEGHYKRETHSLSTFEFYNDLHDLQKEQEREKHKSHLKVKYA